MDPVPFLVVVAAGFLGCFSCGPIYLMEFGVRLPGALALSAVAFLATTALAYHRFVWTARPDLRSEIPAPLRVRHLLLGSLVVIGVLTLLALPLFRP